MNTTRELIVIKKTMVTPHMLRVTLGGNDVKSLPADLESAYVKLIFPVEKGRLTRTYTIRHQRATEIDIDFMLHEPAGLACTWAKNAKPNDVILVGGPGPKKMIVIDTDWQLLVGDMTALPAISVNLASLPENAKGYAFIEVVSEEDIQNLSHPTGIELKWIINPYPGKEEATLLNHVLTLPWPSESLSKQPSQEDVSVWAACEFNSMKLLRTFFKEQKAIKKENLYLSSYWKLGSNEDQHKVIKREDNALA